MTPAEEREYLIRQVAELRVMLHLLRRNPGECLMDHPKWIAEIDKLLARKP